MFLGLSILKTFFLLFCRHLMKTGYCYAVPAKPKEMTILHEENPVAAYIIVDVKINDPFVYAEYMKLTPACIAAYGGRFVVRGGKHETLEGEWSPGRVVVLEFESAARAKEWWSSTAYAPAKALRQKSADTKMIVVDGV